MDIETAARAMFERLHAMNHRPRNWLRHSDEDIGAELGRNTFRELAAVAAGVAPPAEPAVDHTYSSDAPSVGLVANDSSPAAPGAA